jgi:LSD1 subclass zinc finger protein
MTIENFTCPNCGAPLSVTPGQELVTCAYCKASLRIPGLLSEAKQRPEPAPQPAPESPASMGSSFHMVVEDVFFIRGRGTVITGNVASGTVHLGDRIIIWSGAQVRRTVVAGIEMFRKTLDHASSGDNVGLLLKDISKDMVKRGDILAIDENLSE